jgi:hypothetical protein
MSEKPSPKIYNLNQAAAYLGIQPHSFRTQVRKGKVEGQKAAHPTLPNIERWTFTQEQLDAYQDSKGSVGRREDGRNKYTIYLTPEELAALTEANPDLLISRANPPKSA